MDYKMTHYEYASKRDLTGLDLVFPLLEKEFKSQQIDFRTFADWFIKNFGDDPILSLGPQEVTMATNFLYHYWRMKVCGEKIFYVSPQLFYMLLNTEVNVDVEWISSPFEEIFIYCEQKEIMITDVNDGICRPVQGIYLNFRRDNHDNVKRMRFIATSGAEGCSEFKDVNYSFCFELPEHGTMEDAIKYTFDSMAANRIKVFDMGSLNKESIQKIFRFTSNLLLYLSSKDPDLFPVTPTKLNVESKKSPRKIKKAIQKSMRTVEMPFIVIGKNLPHDYTIHGSGFSITHKFSVRGHWRNQWKGSEIDKTRRQEYIWIKPYQKGKDFQEQLNKKYSVGREMDVSHRKSNEGGDPS